MDVLRQDLGQAARALLRAPAFTAVVISTLALGVGLNAAVFSLVHSTLLEPLPYRNPDRLVMVWTAIPAEGVREAGSAYANIQDWEAQNRVFEELATFDPTSLTLTGGEWPEQISTARVSANFFSVLRVAPAVGRTFSPQEERRRASVVVVSHDLWRRRFNASPDAIGGTLAIAGSRFQVVGVMPEGFAFPDRNTQLWLPQTLFTDWEEAVARRGTDAWRVIGRLRPGASLDRTRAEMRTIAARLAERHPESNAGLSIAVVPLYEQVTGSSFRLALWTLFGAVGLVLLIACANAAHLILARGMDRGPELALRQALGATTSRLVRHALAETLLLSVAAGVAAVLLAHEGLRLLVALAPADLPRLEEIGIGGPVFIYAAVVSLAAGALFGLAPALSLSRGSLFGLLREGGGPARRSGGDRARSVLIVFQFALAIILVFSANLLIRSLLEARSVDPGFVTDDVLMANLLVESSSERVSFYERAVQDVQAIPGVRAAGIIEDLFISGAPNRAIVIDGRASDGTSFEEIRIDAIAGDFFQAMGVPLRAGRAFSGGDGAEGVPVAIINESMARRFWPGESPIGKRFRTGPEDTDAPWIEIVGLVGDMHRQGLERESIPQAFRPYTQEPSRGMRSELPAAALASTLRRRIAAIDRTVPLYRVTTVTDALDEYLLERRFQTFLLGIFSAIALLLAAVGIYGLMTYSVARRSRELAMRMALGASSERLIALIVRQGLTLAVPGLVAGIVCAVWLAEIVSPLLFGVAPSDLGNLLVTAGILVFTALVACSVPAWRAASVEPMAALRCR